MSTLFECRHREGTGTAWRIYMSVKKEFFLDSNDNSTKLHVVMHIPEGEPVAVLQISHGMVEYIDRYDDFAKYLNDYGIIVIGNDHLGHGASVVSKDNFGYFSEKKGNRILIEDLHAVTKYAKEKYKNLPYFLLGHSMGSFYARQYICDYGNELDGAIIMGTGNQPLCAAIAGIVLTWIMAIFKGWKYRSKFIDKMAFGGYNKKFTPSRTDKDWLSKDKEKVDEYLADERCTFIFTLNAYNNMFRGIARLHKKSLLKKMPKELPLFVVAGNEDPVGNFGRGVKKFSENLKKVGMKNVLLKLYPDDRHEILNETDRLVVYNDIKNWIFGLLR